MKKEDWKKVADIVSNALALGEKEREKYVFEQSKKFPELKGEIESLIHMEGEADDYFDSSEGFHFTNFWEDDAVSANVGQIIGSYRIIKELGIGGMGAVFLAERTDGEFTQKVAIKMLRREFNTSKIRQRFEKEKEIQAKLIHPNIARLIDAGTTEDGIPYFVMEYIEGINICDYSQKENLSLEECLKLFNKVCDAVAFAHRNLIIHRDLKPSNIIVTKNGEPKLLDFGISKLLNEELNETHTVTKMGVMTPEYASPEQVRGKSVTTSTDIYSLGIILFELLTGSRPFGNEIRKSDDLLKAIIEEEPKRPSDILSQARLIEIPKVKREAIQEYEKASSTQPATQILDEAKTKRLINETRPQFSSIYPKQLNGDIDNIVLKALRKESERRYQTVEQLSADIWRHLDGMPVSARPATFSYRASKFIKRNRYGVMASGIIILAIISGLITTLWQARRAEIQRVKAEQRFNDVRGLANSILFKVYPTVEKLEGSIEARQQIVENALKYLDSLSKEASENTELQLELADAYKKIGDVQGNNKYPNLGDLKGSLESYQKAVGLIRDVHQKQPNDDRVKSKLADALEQEAFVLWWMGDNPKTYTKYDEAVKLYQELIRSNPGSIEHKFSLADLYLFYGDVPYWENKYDEAGKIYELAHNSLKEIVRQNPNDLEKKAKYAYSFGRLAKIDMGKGNYEESIKKLKTSEEIAQGIVDKNPKSFKFRETLWGAQFSTCEMYIVKGDAEGAIKSCPVIIETQKKQVELEPNNITAKYNLSMSYNYLGRAYRMKKNYDKALESFDESIKNMDLVLRDNPKNIGYRQEKLIAVHSKGVLYERQNDLKAAQEVYEQVIEGYEKLLKEIPNEPRSKLNLFKTHADLSKNLLAQNQTNKAKIVLEKSIEQGNVLAKEKALSDFDRKILERVKSDLEKLN